MAMMALRTSSRKGRFAGEKPQGPGSAPLWGPRWTRLPTARKVLVCRQFAFWVLGHEWATRSGRHVHAGNTTRSFSGTSKDGSDGTRTRDLRRDRPTREWRRTSTNRSERPYLQGTFRPTPTPARMVEPIVNRRLGHEWATTYWLGRPQRRASRSRRGRRPHHVRGFITSCNVGRESPLGRPSLPTGLDRPAAN
jgi:hypothetical protein